MLGAEHPERYLPYPWACTSGRHSPSRCQRPPADMAHQRRPRPSPTTILVASVSRLPQPPHEKASGRPPPCHRPLRPASTTRSPHRPFGQASTILSPVFTLPYPTPQA